MSRPGSRGRPSTSRPVKHPDPVPGLKLLTARAGHRPAPGIGTRYKTGSVAGATETEHLNPYKWKKGQSGNPSGRAKHRPNLANTLSRILRRPTEMRGDVPSRFEMDEVGEAIVREMKAGNMVAVAFVAKQWPQVLEPLEIQSSRQQLEAEGLTPEQLESEADEVARILGEAGFSKKKKKRVREISKGKAK